MTKSRKWVPYAFILPAFLIHFLVVMAPSLSTFVMSLYDWNGMGEGEFIGLKNFVEELEEKMPSNITVETFSSTGTQVSFSMRLANKSEAANTLIQLRSFESLLLVNTTGIDEAEDGTVTMSVTCTYINPAPLDVGAN